MKNRFIAAANASGDPHTIDVGRKLKEENHYSFVDAKADKRLHPNTRTFFDRYDGTGVAYDYIFDITETSGAGASIDFVRPLTGGTLTAGFGAGADLTRQNQRSFILGDTFEILLTKLSASECRKIETGSNWLYPIRGEIGLSEMIDTFIELDETGVLVKGVNPAPTMIDILEFTTNLSVSAHPSLELAKAGRRWQTTKFTASDTGIHAGRVDKHKVTIALSVQLDPPSSAPKTIAAKPVRRQTSTAERNAAEAIVNQQTIQFFNPRLNPQNRGRFQNLQ